MSATALIVFREVLEAALVVGIVMAATRGLPGRNAWIGAGLALGAGGAVLVAAFAGAIAAAASGMGQELFNAAVLFIAVAMLGWHNVWMSRAGRAMARELTAVGRAVRDAERPIYILAIVVGVAVLREGSEVVLFLYGIAAAQGTDAGAMLAGGAVGLALGIAAGAVIYFGLIRLAGRYLFAITGGMILLLAAGMAAQGAKFLSQAGYLPTLGHGIWDTSAVISDGGPLGNLLHVLIGYSARPDGIQLVFYIATLVAIGGLMYLFRTPKARVAAVAAVAIVAAAATFGPTGGEPARAADLKVYSPVVEEGEFAIEARGNLTFDDAADKDRAQSQRYEIEYTPNDFWHTALVGKLEQAAEGSLRYTATAWENILQLFPQGQQWLDLGVYLEYELARDRSDADAFEGKILAEKNLGRVAFTVNPTFEQEIGGDDTDSTEFKYAARVKWRWKPELEPAIEAYGDIGEIGDVKAMRAQRHQVGPVLLGTFRLTDTSKLRYEAGYLFGLTSDGSPDGAFKWLVEVEHYF
ncbi:MAG TPA: FTR1 family protein [Alphaproteobacteria bacterium]